MKYRVKYENKIIGIYNVIDDNNVEYVVDKEQIKNLEKENISLNPMLRKDFKGDKFPLFDNRIKNSKRFGNVEIGYHTDPITLELLKE